MAEGSSKTQAQERTQDSLFDGELFCIQHRHGYRFSIDPVLLAHFVRLGKEETVLDLGAGCGVAGLILLYRLAASIRSLTAFELQSGLAQLGRENITANGFADKARVVEGDLRQILQLIPAESHGVVICNPPFYAAGSGRSSSNTEACIARHQVACSLDDILSAASAVLKNRGRLFLIYPAEGLGTLLARLPIHHLAVKRLQFVYSYPDPVAPARLFLIECVKNGGEGMVVESPFHVYVKKDGEYSPAMNKLYQPNPKRP